MTASSSDSPRQRLLDTASNLFYENGIAATGIDTILSAAGVAKMTLYNQFGSKEGLVREYLTQRYGGFLAFVRKAVEERTQDDAKRIMALFDVVAEWIQGAGYRGCPLLHAVIECSQASHPVRDTASNLVAGLHGYLAELAGHAGAREPAKLADELCMLVYGAVSWSLITRSPAAGTRAKEMAQLLLAQEGITPTAQR